MKLMKMFKTYVLISLIGIILTSCDTYQNASHFNEERLIEREKIENSRRYIDEAFVLAHADMYLSVISQPNLFVKGIPVLVYGDYQVEDVIINDFYLRDENEDKVTFNSTTAILNYFYHLGFELISESMYSESNNKRYTFKRMIEKNEVDDKNELEYFY